MAIFKNQSGSHDNGVASYTVGISDDRFTLETIDNELYVIDKDHNPLPINDYSTKKTEIDLNYNIPLKISGQKIMNVVGSCLTANNDYGSELYYTNENSIVKCSIIPGMSYNELGISIDSNNINIGEKCNIVFNDVYGKYLTIYGSKSSNIYIFDKTVDGWDDNAEHIKYTVSIAHLNDKFAEQLNSLGINYDNYSINTYRYCYNKLIFIAYDNEQYINTFIGLYDIVNDVLTIIKDDSNGDPIIGNNTPGSSVLYCGYINNKFCLDIVYYSYPTSSYHIIRYYDNTIINLDDKIQLNGIQIDSWDTKTNNYGPPIYVFKDRIVSYDHISNVKNELIYDKCGMNKYQYNTGYECYATYYNINQPDKFGNEKSKGYILDMYDGDAGRIIFDIADSQVDGDKRYEIITVIESLDSCIEYKVSTSLNTDMYFYRKFDSDNSMTLNALYKNPKKVGSYLSDLSDTVADNKYAISSLNKIATQIVDCTITDTEFKMTEIYGSDLKSGKRMYIKLSQPMKLSQIIERKIKDKNNTKYSIKLDYITNISNTDIINNLSDYEFHALDVIFLSNDSGSLDAYLLNAITPYSAIAHSSNQADRLTVPYNGMVSTDDTQTALVNMFEYDGTDGVMKLDPVGFSVDKLVPGMRMTVHINNTITSNSGCSASIKLANGTYSENVSLRYNNGRVMRGMLTKGETYDLVYREEADPYYEYETNCYWDVVSGKIGYPINYINFDTKSHNDYLGALYVYKVDVSSMSFILPYPLIFSISGQRNDALETGEMDFSNYLLGGSATVTISGDIRNPSVIINGGSDSTLNIKLYTDVIEENDPLGAAITYFRLHIYIEDTIVTREKRCLWFRTIQNPGFISYGDNAYVHRTEGLIGLGLNGTFSIPEMGGVNINNLIVPTPDVTGGTISYDGTDLLDKWNIANAISDPEVLLSDMYINGAVQLFGGSIALNTSSKINVDNLSNITFDTSSGDKVILNGDAINELNDKIDAKANKENANGGFAAGQNAQADQGGAVGRGAKTSDGFAGGKEAKCENDGNAIDAIQLGTGTNTTSNTLQVYSYTLMNADGTIPTNRLQNSAGGFAGGKYASCDDINGAPIDAIQLGTGTNLTAKTLQIYDYTLMDTDGTIPTERLQNSAGGFAGGEGSSAGSGAAVGSNATADSGGAVGDGARSNTGGAVGSNVTADTGGAVGDGAYSNTGGAIGQSAGTSSGGAVGNDAHASSGGAVGQSTMTDTGGAVGDYAYAYSGGAVGKNTYTETGGAVGQNAMTSDGFAGGKDAKCEGSNGSIDAIQLGTGTNATAKTLQVYDYTLMNADGTIPYERYGAVIDAKIAELVDEKIAESKPTITTLTDTEITITLNDNTDTRCGEVTTMSINMPTSISDDYTSSIIFTSGATATVFDYPDTIKMIGEGCVDGRFVPGLNKRYEIIISYDGVNFVGAVGGYAI